MAKKDNTDEKKLPMIFGKTGARLDRINTNITKGDEQIVEKIETNTDILSSAITDGLYELNETLIDIGEFLQDMLDNDRDENALEAEDRRERKRKENRIKPKEKEKPGAPTKEKEDESSWLGKAAGIAAAIAAIPALILSALPSWLTSEAEKSSNIGIDKSTGEMTGTSKGEAVDTLFTDIANAGLKATGGSLREDMIDETIATPEALARVMKGNEEEVQQSQERIRDLMDRIAEAQEDGDQRRIDTLQDQLSRETGELKGLEDKRNEFQKKVQAQIDSGRIKNEELQEELADTISWLDGFGPGQVAVEEKDIGILTPEQIEERRKKNDELLDQASKFLEDSVTKQEQNQKELDQKRQAVEKAEWDALTEEEKSAKRLATKKEQTAKKQKAWEMMDAAYQKQIAAGKMTQEQYAEIKSKFWGQDVVGVEAENFDQNMVGPKISGEATPAPISGEATPAPISGEATPATPSQSERPKQRWLSMGQGSMSNLIPIKEDNVMIDYKYHPGQAYIWTDEDIREKYNAMKRGESVQIGYMAIPQDDAHKNIYGTAWKDEGKAKVEPVVNEPPKIEGESTPAPVSGGATPKEVGGITFGPAIPEPIEGPTGSTYTSPSGGIPEGTTIPILSESNVEGSNTGAVPGVADFAEGGIVNAPETGGMAVLHGREAIIPLNDQTSIDQVSDALSKVMLLEGLTEGLDVKENKEIEAIKDKIREQAKALGITEESLKVKPIQSKEDLMAELLGDSTSKISPASTVSGGNAGAAVNGKSKGVEAAKTMVSAPSVVNNAPTTVNAPSTTNVTNSTTVPPVTSKNSGFSRGETVADPVLGNTY